MYLINLCMLHILYYKVDMNMGSIITKILVGMFKYINY